MKTRDTVTLEDISINGTTIIISILVDCTDDIAALPEAGVLQNDFFKKGLNDYVSFTKTQQNMEMQGYRAVTE